MWTTRPSEGGGAGRLPTHDTTRHCVSLAGLLGLAVGSFANVVIHRRRESVVRPGSRCPSCGEPVAWRDNLPLLGWLLPRPLPPLPGAHLPKLSPGRAGHGRALVLHHPAAGLGFGWAVPAYLALAFICVELAR